LATLYFSLQRDTEAERCRQFIDEAVEVVGPLQGPAQTDQPGFERHLQNLGKLRQP
jgi:hypothetical protein